MTEYRILHLEDSYTDADLVKRQLQRSGLIFDYFLADDEQSFKEGLINFNPDVILCDHALPQFDSVRALEIYNRMKLETVFILVTGSVSEEYAVAMMKNGVDDYLLKSNMQRLPEAIKNAYDKRKNNRERKEAVEELHRSKANLRTIFDNTATSYTLMDKELCAITYNKVSSDFVFEQFRTEAKAGAFVPDYFPEPRRSVLIGMMKEVLLGKQYSYEISYVRPSGAVKWFSTRLIPVLNNEKNIIGLMMAVSDITDRKNYEQEILLKNEELIRLSAHLQHIREEERTYISREIHDELGQQLTALKMDIASIIHKNKDTDTIVEKLHEVLLFSDDIINTVRRISSDLRPAIIDDLGLLAALEWKCSDFEEKTSVPCQFISTVKERKFENDFGINVFRILQETLTNVSRHANARSVFVKISENGNELLLEITDDGKGINTDKIRSGKTLGVIGMKERAALLGGELIITGAENKGTSIKLKLPLKNEYTNS